MHRLTCWLCCWVDLIVSIIRLSSFHFIDPSWDLNFRVWILKLRTNKRKIKRNPYPPTQNPVCKKDAFWL